MSSSKISDQNESWCSGQNRTVDIGMQVLNGKVTVVSVTEKKNNPHSGVSVVSEIVSRLWEAPCAELGRNRGCAASGTSCSPAERSRFKAEPC